MVNRGPCFGGGHFKGYLTPSNLPSLFLRPERVVGIPVAFAIFRLNAVTPSARFQLNDRPGILKPFFDISVTDLQNAFVARGQTTSHCVS